MQLSNTWNHKQSCINKKIKAFQLINNDLRLTFLLFSTTTWECEIIATSPNWQTIGRFLV